MKRIGILTADGDTPALNATVHGAVTRVNQPKLQIHGLIKGFDCLFNSYPHGCSQAHPLPGRTGMSKP